MNLEIIFFNNFFYPFLLSVLICSLVITLFLGFFTNNYYEKRTHNNIINLEKKYSKIILNSVEVLLKTSFLKIQASLNEQIIHYQQISKKIIYLKETPELNNTFLKSYINIDPDYCITNEEESFYTSYWLLDNETTEEHLNDDSKKEVKQQLIAYSNMIANIESSLEATKPNAISFYFYFEKTELYISYPISADCENNYFYEMKNLSYKDDDVTCLNNDGLYYDVYKLKCEPFFIIMQKSKTNSFDNNYLPNKNKTIFITNYYSDADDLTDREYSMCIEFDDPITNEKAYVCADVYNEDMVSSLEDLNSKIDGYFFITLVGFNNVFYFPQGTISPKTSIENVFQWNNNFNLEEKVYFYSNIRKIFSSNYINYMRDSIYDEIFINGKNSSGQYFFMNGEKLKYSIYPIIFENLNEQKEHIFSIIYIYSEQLLLEKMNKYNSSLFVKILLECLMFIIFGSGLLYIIYLTFNKIAKYIVIPIKNMNYMLKGINIGGNNRLKYLSFLKKKQDENLEKLEKIYLFESNKANSINNFTDEIDSDLEINYEKNNLTKPTNKNDDFNKQYDEESDYIKKEYNFYDFDEQLLQYRPLEIENLTKSLLDIKSTLIFTSADRQLDHIIDYSNSEKIFRTFRNQEGTLICQSNIGNLQSQLLKFDKAIFHLALSLQDNQLQKFLNRNLNDKFDESDSLLNKILYTFNKEKNKMKNNILTLKQMNNSKDNFSQKNISILINTRYCRLIQVYYMFFKKLKKLKKANYNIINGLFMNTQFHNINYYHKIIIQFIFLCYIKNDLVKIGEGILDYLEFLIKFKFKTSHDSKYFLKIKYKDYPKYQFKQDCKKKIFNKIINWFNLFDDYISYIKDNSSIGDNKGIIDYFSSLLNSENNELNLESQSTILFRINIQKCYFLKGKFCYYCKSYKDALFYFIHASKTKSLVKDGLIQKRSLKYILKLLLKMQKKYSNYKIKNLYFDQEITSYKKNKNLNNLKKGEKTEYKGIITFGEKIEEIKEVILEDINECNAKQEKDIIILIDFNIYNNQNDKLNSIKYKIDRFIDQTIIILNNYLSINDRFSLFIYTNKYKIICPLMYVKKIDIKSFSKDLTEYKNDLFNEGNEEKEFNLELDSNIKFNFEKNNNVSEKSEEDSFEISDKEENMFDKIKGLVETINYLNVYLNIKESEINEKYIILFTDIFNMKLNDNEKIEKIFKKLKRNENIIFLSVGKNKNSNIKKDKNKIYDSFLEKIIMEKFGEKSEIIYFENMKKIKSILSNNNLIKDVIIYPNEIYK